MYLPNIIDGFLYFKSFDKKTNTALYEEKLPFKTSNNKKTFAYNIKLKGTDYLHLLNNSFFGFSKNRGRGKDYKFAIYGNSIEGFQIACLAKPQMRMYTPNFNNGTKITLSKDGTNFKLFITEKGLYFGSSSKHCINQDCGDINKNLTIWGQAESYNSLESCISLIATTTNINDIEKNINSSTYYQLNGLSTLSPQRGNIYIIDNNKIIR